MGHKRYDGDISIDYEFFSDDDDETLCECCMSSYTSDSSGLCDNCRVELNNIKHTMDNVSPCVKDYYSMYYMED